MLKKPPTCSGCPLYDDGMGYVPDEIVAGSEIMIVLQSPGANEEECGRPAVGDAGTYMNEHFIKLLGKTRDEVSVGNILKCRWRHPKTGQKTSKLPSETGVWNKDKKKWDQVTGKEIEKLAVTQCLLAHWQVPKHIKHLLMLGDKGMPTQMVTGVSTLEWRGFLAPEKLNGRRVFLSLLPSYLLQTPRMAIPAAIDWSRFRRVTEGKFPQPIPKRDIIANGGYFGYIPPTTSYATFDLEYDPATSKPCLAGIAYFNSFGEVLGGVQAWTKDIDQAAWRSWLLTLFWAFPVVMHNAVADLEVLAKEWDIWPKHFSKLHDTIQMMSTLHSEWQKGLDFCESLYGRHERLKHLFDTNLLLYNWGDCLTTGYTYHQLSAEMAKDNITRVVYENENMPVVPIRLQSKIEGLRLNRSFLSRTADDLAHRAVMAQKIAGMYSTIDIGSPSQISKFLKAEGLKLPTNRETGNDSTDKDVIAELRRLFLDYDPELEKDGITPEQLLANIEAGGHPILEAVACYRGSADLRNHYIKPLLKDGVDKKKVHYDEDEFQEYCYPDQHTHTQTSGRWSTVSPPLPTLPKKLKSIIIPRLGTVFIGFDFDQQELRADAHISCDEPTLEAFAHGFDIHTLNTCDIFNYPKPPDLKDPHKASENTAWRELIGWEGKDDKRRTFSKRFVYRVRYRGNPKYAGDIPGAKHLKLTPQSLIEASNNYLAAHPMLKKYWKENDQRILTTRTVRTPLVTWSGLSGGGRKRFLSGWGAKSSPGEVPPICREGTNHPFQGLGADALYLSIQVISVETKDLGTSWGYGAHDSQKWVVPIQHVSKAQERILEIMERRWCAGGRELYLPITLDKPTYAPEEVPHG